MTTNHLNQINLNTSTLNINLITLLVFFFYSDTIIAMRTIFNKQSKTNGPPGLILHLNLDIYASIVV